MSFSLGMERIIESVRSTDISNKREEKDPPDKKKIPNKCRILDNTRIHGLKSEKSESLVLFIGVMFVSSVVAVVTYGKLKEIDNSSSSSSIGNQFEFDTPDINIEVASDTSSTDYYYTTMASLTPLSYLLYISANISSSIYRATVKIRVKCIHETTTISLHTFEHKIKKITISKINKTDVRDVRVVKYSYNKNYNMLVLTLSGNLSAGYEYNLFVAFHSELTSESKGMFVREYQDGNGVKKRLISAMFQLGSARNVFPCFDEPSYKAPLKIILQHNKTLSAISNMPVEKTVTMEDGLVETYFEKSLLITTHYFSFVIAEYSFKEIVISKGLMIRLYAPEGRVRETNTAIQMIPSFIQYYQKMFGMSYKLKKLDFVPMDMLSLQASVSPGLIILPEHLLLLDDRKKTQTQIELCAKTLSQVLVKQLFSYLMELESGGDVWFTESMSLFLGYEAIKYIYPSWDIKTMFYLDITETALMEDEKNLIEPVRDQKDQYASKRIKGAAVFNMISRYVGQPTFRKSFLSFCNDKRNKGGGTSSDNFIDSLSKIIPQDGSMDVMKSWFMHPGFPLVTMHPASTVQYVFKQKEFAPTDKPLRWWIPIVVGSICDKTTSTFVLNTETEKVKLTKCSLHKANYGGDGFYRLDYNREDTSNFINLLNTKHQSLPPVDRANLIADVFAIARWNPGKVLTALDFTNYLGEEHHFVPYKIALTQLSEISRLFAGTTNENCVKQYIRKKTEPVLLYLDSLKEHDYMQKKLIALLLREAVTYDHNVAISLDNIFLRWVISNFTLPLPDNLRELIFEVGIMRGSSYVWNDLFSYFKRCPSQGEKDLALSGLAMTTNKLFLKQLLEYANRCTISSATCIRDKLKIWTKICQNSNGGKVLVTNDFLNQWKYLTEKAEYIFEDLKRFMFSCLGSGRTTGDIKQVKALNVDLVPPIRTLTLNVIQYITRKIKLNKEDIAAWFIKEIPGCL